MKLQKLFIFLLLTVICCTQPVTRNLHALNMHRSDKPAAQHKERLCGGFTDQHELTDDDMALFNKVMGKSIFSPISVATQVVAGLNYRFWCRYDAKGEDSPAFCYITIYQPLRGDPVLSSVQNEKGGPEGTVIIDNEGNTGRYVGENESSYHGFAQDDYWIEKGKARLEAAKARDGQGILTLTKPGRKPVFSSPDISSEKVGTMIHKKGYIPEVYQCLGYINGWFLTETDGRTGFIRESLVTWDAVNSF